jgi:hypothetical protein
LPKDRVIVDFHTPGDAKKVEETVKTGYAEAAIENILQWTAVEHDLRESYAKLAEEAKETPSREIYLQLQRESEANLAELGRLLADFEELDRARVKRIELLGSLGP